MATGELYSYNTMNSETYCNQIVAQMIEALKSQFNSEDFLIAHDNAKFVQSNYTIQYLYEKGYSKYFVPIPTYSPDMNIIDNLWAHLKHQVRDHYFHYGQTKRRRHFEGLISDKWSEIPLSMIENLYESL